MEPKGAQGGPGEPKGAQGGPVETKGVPGETTSEGRSCTPEENKDMQTQFTECTGILGGTVHCTVHCTVRCDYI